MPQFRIYYNERVATVAIIEAQDADEAVSNFHAGDILNEETASFNGEIAEIEEVK